MLYCEGWKGRSKLTPFLSFSLLEMSSTSRAFNLLHKWSIPSSKVSMWSKRKTLGVWPQLLFCSFIFYIFVLYLWVFALCWSLFNFFWTPLLLWKSFKLLEFRWGILSNVLEASRLTQQLMGVVLSFRILGFISGKNGTRDASVWFCHRLHSSICEVTQDGGKIPPVVHSHSPKEAIYLFLFVIFTLNQSYLNLIRLIVSILLEI